MHHPLHNSSPLFSLPNQIKPVHTLPSLIFRTLGFLSGLLALRFPRKTLYTFLVLKIIIIQLVLPISTQLSSLQLQFSSNRGTTLQYSSNRGTTLQVSSNRCTTLQFPSSSLTTLQFSSNSRTTLQFFMLYPRS